MDVPSELSWTHPVTAEWFVTKFGTPTEPQAGGWPSILAGKPTLISAPTGSGKTLAAFLVAIDRLLRQAIGGCLPPTTQVVYVSPLKALSNDVQKNLDEPLAEIQKLAIERGYLSMNIRTGVRTGDPLPKEMRFGTGWPLMLRGTAFAQYNTICAQQKADSRNINLHGKVCAQYRPVSRNKNRGASDCAQLPD
jgi:ATP-dependent helicase YprA (DUF1998 family)